MKRKKKEPVPVTSYRVDPHILEFMFDFPAFFDCAYTKTYVLNIKESPDKKIPTLFGVINEPGRTYPFFNREGRISETC